jgi:hypothetical protein
MVRCGKCGKLHEPPFQHAECPHDFDPFDPLLPTQPAPQTTDIAAELRRLVANSDAFPWETMEKAAAEIERLRAALRIALDHISGAEACLSAAATHINLAMSDE